ncbi:uncharacterized protein [Procambarus clarkii]|uniref:uncharacterized protein isoform X2 n=1 Tax=Procambarus clarkii TaxID=6728 RepID=UPI001E677920|nr:uncharacterized protein LOC123759708 [Procambarus clarkii]
METYRAPKVNRYWKRPKPKVYDCNVRDAERFYQENYKRYLSEKEEAAAKAARSRSIDSDKIEFYPHLRAGPIRRDPSSRSSSTRSDFPPIPPSQPEGFKSRLDSDRSSAETSFTSRVEGLPSYDSAHDSSSLEERLERLKRLREELGLPADTKTGYASSSLSARSGSATRTTGSGLGDFETSYKSERTSRSAAGGGPEETSSYSFKSEKSSRMNGTGGLGEDYKLKSERNTDGYRIKSERGTDDYKYKSESNNDYKLPTRLVEFELPKVERKPLNLSPKLERKKDYSFASSAEKKADRFSSLSSAGTSTSVSGGRSSRRVAADLEIDDDDTSVVDMMKKLPSSQDILERISKMDLDD